MRTIFFFILTILLATACEKKDVPVNTAILTETVINLSDIEPKGIVPTPAALTLALGEKTSLSLTGLFPYGKIAPLTTGVTWTVADESILTVDANGNATALKVGTTRLLVAYKAVSEVVPVTVTEAAPMQLILLPESSHVELGLKLGQSQNQEFSIKAFSLMTDGQLIDVSKEAVWIVDDSEKIEIASSEKFIAKATGNFVLKASYAGLYAKNKVKVEQTPLKVLRLEATTDNFVMRYGDSATIPVRAIMNDESIVTNLTGVTLSSSNPQIEFNGTQVIARGLGQHTIDVRYGEASLTLPIYMREADPIDLVISPSSINLSRGEQANITVKANMSDGSIVDVTSSMTAVSLDTTVSTVSGNRITAVANGANLLRIRFKSAVLDTAVTVGNQTLNALEIRPASFNLAAGTSASFQVFGIYTNGDELDLTTVATLSTIHSSKADLPSIGSLRAKVAGVTKLSAFYQTPSPESRNLTASADISIQDAFLQSIVFEPTSSTKALGRSEEFKVKGRYSDGSEIDITTVVEITADVSSAGMSYAAKIARTGSNRIRVTGRAIGTMKVIASFGSVSGEALFHATKKEIDRVDIVRDQPYSAQGFILKSDTANFMTKLTFSDLSTENIAASDATRTVAWSLPDANYASFVLNNGKMLFTAVKEGPAGFGVTVTEGSNVKSATFGMDIFIPCTSPGRQNSYFCWYLSDNDKSCDDTCSLQYRANHSASNSYAGYGGTDEECKYLVEEVFKDDIVANFSANAQPSVAIGCSIYTQGGVNVGARQKTLPTTGEAHLTDFRRICSCE